MSERYNLGERTSLGNGREYIELKRKPLTSSQHDTYSFLYEVAQEGRQASIRDIMDRFGLKTPSAGHERLQALFDKGYIHYEQGRSRSAIPMIPLDKVDVKGGIKQGSNE